MITLFGNLGSRQAYELRDFLQRSNVPFSWSQVDGPADLNPRQREAGRTITDLPFVEFASGEVLLNASVRSLATKMGWVAPAKCLEYDVSIYGAGPAGLSAAVYAASEGLKTVLIERATVGGQAGTSSLIENFLGYPQGISGAEIAEKARLQALKFGAEILLLREGVHGVFRDNHIHVNLADGGELVAKANICATGVEYLRLNLPNEAEFLGRGLYYGGGLSEGAFCQDEEVFVVGGANSAGQAAAHLSRFAKRVTMLVRGASLGESMSAYLLEKLKKVGNVEYRFHSEVVELDGRTGLERIRV
ncbi:MAG: FAD-dependent oxidoreductase, partial [Proteobacteria bacterium]